MITFSDNGIDGVTDTLLSVLRSNPASSNQFMREVQSWQDCNTIMQRDCEHHLEVIGLQKNLLNSLLKTGGTSNEKCFTNVSSTKLPSNGNRFFQK